MRMKSETMVALAGIKRQEGKQLRKKCGHKKGAKNFVSSWVDVKLFLAL